ncbi:ADP-ribosylation factor-like protein 6-interacting protein 1 [Sipha flava]|uniref:ADP-ribosylation factor-like protein 6-interacting protein 1 n=1 Tax=Sipha flava TaxID=143950 RepID=A0A8B8FF72_9HEMI|nr:ADP-ribosylation factor-like protein 6-interacting protein 1 [Sipha flava]
MILSVFGRTQFRLCFTRCNDISSESLSDAFAELYATKVHDQTRQCRKPRLPFVFPPTAKQIAHRVSSAIGATVEPLDRVTLVISCPRGPLPPNTLLFVLQGTHRVHLPSEDVRPLMADAECTGFPDKEKISKRLKVYLNEWREIIVMLNAIMEWKKNWFPAITVTCVTSLFFYVWLVNCSTLNIFWTICLCTTLLDYIVCGPFQKMLPPNSWDQEKEDTYTIIVESIAEYCVTLRLYMERFFKLRQTNTRLFHAVLSVSFFSLLYIGITFNNLIMSYITVLVILLFPGFKIRSEYIEDSIQHYINLMVSYLWSSDRKISPL